MFGLFGRTFFCKTNATPLSLFGRKTHHCRSRHVGWVWWQWKFYWCVFKYNPRLNKAQLFSFVYKTTFFVCLLVFLVYANLLIFLHQSRLIIFRSLCFKLCFRSPYSSLGVFFNSLNSTFSVWESLFLAFSLPVTHFENHNTDLPSNSNVSKTVKVSIAFRQCFFKEYLISFLIICRLIDFVLVFL